MAACVRVSIRLPFLFPSSVIAFFADVSGSTLTLNLMDINEAAIILLLLILAAKLSFSHKDCSDFLATVRLTFYTALGVPEKTLSGRKPRT